MAPRVLVLSRMYPSTSDPSHGTFIHEHVAALVAAGAEVRVVSPVPWAPRILWHHARWRQYGRARGAYAWEGVSVERPAYLHPPGPRSQAFAGVPMAACLLPVLAHIRRTFPFDLIHAHAVTPDGLAGLLLARSLGVPVVCSARGSELHEAPLLHASRRWSTRQTLLRCDATVAVSGALAEIAASITDERVRPRVIYSGVDTACFRPPSPDEKRQGREQAGVAPHRFVYAFVGRVERDKGVLELARAFVETCHQGIDGGLLVVGRGDALPALRDVLDRSRLLPRLIAPGTCSRRDVAAWLRVADAFVLPSYGEGMPNALLEAMSTGLPSICTPVGGVPEIFSDGAHGTSVPAQDASALAAAMLALARAPDRGTSLGAAARRRILERLSWSAHARQHLELYDALLASATPAPSRRGPATGQGCRSAEGNMR